MRITNIFSIVFTILFLGNLLLLDVVFTKQKTTVGELETKILTLNEELSMVKQTATDANSRWLSLSVATASAVSDACPQSCNDLISNAIRNIPPQKTIIQNVQSKASEPAASKEYFIPLGSGTITENDKWVDIYGAQAIVDTANYPNLKAAYFEAVMHIPNAQGEMRAKLVETTTPFYYGDIVKTNSGTGELVSVLINLQTGRRNYRVQLYNQIGSGVLDSARIKIVTQ